MRWCVVAGILLLSVGCADDSGTQGSVDGGILNDAGDASAESDAVADGGEIAEFDAEFDAGDGADAEPDVRAPQCAEPPAILVAGTPQTDVLARNAARCGQADFSWLSVTGAGAPAESLGSITEIGSETDMYTVEFIEAAVEALGATLPREPVHDVHITQFGYMTQDRGALIEASAMIAFPRGREATDPPRDIVLLLHGTTGFTDQCAATDQLEYQALAALIASFGYIVVAPDYIGLKAVGEPTGFLHPYLVGQATAIASLDAVRAAMRLPGEERGGWCLNPRVVTVGGSQGGHAALWVDRLAPYYAREIELAGTVATVPPADMLGQMSRALDQLVKASGNTAAFLGASAGWYGYGDRLDEVFVAPLDEQVPQALGGGCDFDDLMPTPTSTADFFQQPLIAAARAGNLAAVEPWGCITSVNGLTSTTVERIAPESDFYGILFVLGENDELVHTPIERESFETLCAQGMKMEYLECAGAEHGETTLLALPEILDFVDARLAGEAFDSPSICEISAPVTCRGAQ
jgi:dienelactone hydrolase